ncbi:MAG TPA: phenylalanine--tRNA ligase subunit beta [Candidatus Aminicenantes bacterium]|nr:phenylalanine--tRNA ligase subunit beta [Candidatus Aminicenantes bacterium]
MRVNLRFLQQFIDVDMPVTEIKELLASLGIEVAEIHSGSHSTTFDVEITPNRPDWLSHLGIAREIHARMPHLQLDLPEYPHPQQTVGEGGDSVEVQIESATDCRRYTGCVVHDIASSPSPAKIATLLESLGMRPINQVVDASNLVIAAMGHPLHMFDLDCLEGKQIRVRRARPGERLRLLDEREVQLDPEDIVIADALRPVALAGIMGGIESGITARTQSVFMESAWFDPVRIRRTARRLGLQTDASYRFERGTDITATPHALGMALGYMQTWSEKPVVTSGYRDEYPGRFQETVVRMPVDFPSCYAGIEIPRTEAAAILERLGFRVDLSSNDSWAVTVPAFRVDITRKQDLVEEIIRIYGYNRIPAAVPRTVNQDFTLNRQRNLRLKAAHHLIANGYFQALNYSFQSLEDNLMMAQTQSTAADSIALRNPLGMDYAVLRNSLIPGLLRATVLNANQGAPGVKLFETGKRFFRYSDSDYREEEALAATAWGEHEPLSWRNPKAEEVDFFVFRGEMQALLSGLGTEFSLKQSNLPWLHPGCSFEIRIRNKPAGWMGCLKQKIMRCAGLEKILPAMEIRLDSLMPAHAVQRFVQWNRFPMVKRDLSVYIPSEVAFADLEKAIAMHRPNELESYQLFDCYRDQADSGRERVSMALSFYYRHAFQTLTGERVNHIHTELVDKLVKTLKLELRT